MNRRLTSILLVALLVFGVLVAATAGVPGASAAGSSAVTGSISGPNLLAEGGQARYAINVTGGPALAANGTIVGNYTYYASVSAPNLTGVRITPGSALILPGAPANPLLVVGSTPEVVTITVMLTSVYQKQNVSTNLTYLVTVVQPYVVAATLVAGSTTVLSFPVQVRLDGSVVGTVTVPTILAGQSYAFSFKYVTFGLSPGAHTFSISLASEHGLVTFPGGASSYSQSFYVPGPPPNYSIWYLAGVLAFAGAIFIFLTRVAARRRGATRR